MQPGGPTARHLRAVREGAAGRSGQSRDHGWRRGRRAHGQLSRADCARLPFGGGRGCGRHNGPLGAGTRLREPIRSSGPCSRTASNTSCFSSTRTTWATRRSRRRSTSSDPSCKSAAPAPRCLVIGSTCARPTRVTTTNTSYPKGVIRPARVRSRALKRSGASCSSSVLRSELGRQAVVPTLTLSPKRVREQPRREREVNDVTSWKIP